jgi:Tfp pilus assembly protein PilO
MPMLTTSLKNKLDILKKLIEDNEKDMNRVNWAYQTQAAKYMALQELREERRILLEIYKDLGGELPKEEKPTLDDNNDDRGDDSGSGKQLIHV